jgi:hypothetical protein
MARAAALRACLAGLWRAGHSLAGLRLVSLCLGLVALAGPAAALSCLPPDPLRTYIEVDASEETWGAVVGRLDFAEEKLPKSHAEDTPAETPLRGQLVGHSLGPDGWKKPFQGNVALMVQCFGPWCAAPRSGATYLVFLKREPHRHVAYADPCGTKLFPNPRRVDLKRLHQCFLSGTCEETPLER